MKKRLRKKLRLGEFSELGFELRIRMAEGLDDEAHEDAIDQFIGEAIEAADLAIGGGYGEVWSFFVTRSSAGSVTEEQRAGVLAWLARDSRFAEVQASPLIDAWYETWDFEAGAVGPMC